MTPFRSVVYSRGMREHLLIDGEPLTLCERVPEHINPGTVDELPAENIVPGNYCPRCIQRAHEIRARER